MKTDELVRRITDARSVLASLWANMTEQQMNLDDAQSGWSVKTFIAHLTHWEHATLETFAERSGTESWKDVHRINEQILQNSRSRSIEEVLHQFDESGKQIISEIRNLTDQELLASSPWNDGKTLWEHLADDTFVHYKEHEPKLRKWIENLQS